MNCVLDIAFNLVSQPHILKHSVLQLNLMFSPTSAIALKGSAVLGELRLGLCSIGPEGVSKLTETLKTVPTLQVLDISCSTVGLTAGKNLGKYCGHN